MSSVSCSGCKFFDPQPANELHGKNYGICTNRGNAYRDYLGDGSSLTTFAITHRDDAGCNRYESIDTQLAFILDDIGIGRMVQQCREWKL